MTIRFDAYTATGVRRGSVDADGRLGDLLETLDALRVSAGVIVPLDGAPPIPDPAGGTNVPSTSCSSSSPRPRRRCRSTPPGTTSSCGRART